MDDFRPSAIVPELPKIVSKQGVAISSEDIPKRPDGTSYRWFKIGVDGTNFWIQPLDRFAAGEN